MNDLRTASAIETSGLALELARIADRAFQLMLPKCEVAVLVHDNHYSLYVDHKRYSQLADPLACDLRSLGWDVEVYRYPWSKIQTSSLRHCSRSINIYFLLSCLWSFIKTLSFRKARLNSWHFLLKQIGCKQIYAIQPAPYICEAAHLAKVAIYDLQHGVITQSSPYYEYCLNPEVNSYLKPDSILFLYKSSYKTWKNKNPVIDLKYIGSPYLADPIHARSSSFDVHGAANVILFSHQVAYGEKWGKTGVDVDGDWTCDGIPLSLAGLLQNIEHPTKLYIRIHPLATAKASNIYALFKKAKLNSIHEVYISNSADAPLPHQLAQTSLHITSHSAVVYEAAELNVASIVLSKSAIIKEQFKQLEREGLVVFCANNDEDILQAASQILRLQQSYAQSHRDLAHAHYRNNFLQALSRHANQ